MSRLQIVGLRFLGRGPFDLTVEASECVCLMGPSGSGKTLLLRAVADLDPRHGRVILDGLECASTPAPQWRRRVGMLPAESQWWANTVGAHFPEDYGKEALGELGFASDVLDWEVERLSSGEKQRLAILRLLANEPSALLLDEPTANLDADNIERAERLFLRYRREKGAAILWVSHDRAQAERVARRLFVLRDGLLQANGRS